MSEIYGKEYYEKYNVGVDVVDYSQSQYTRDFLKSVAERIVRDLNPSTVLDAGCAMGFLVEAMRDLGVEVRHRYLGICHFQSQGRYQALLCSWIIVRSVSK